MVKMKLMKNLSLVKKVFKTHHMNVVDKGPRFCLYKSIKELLPGSSVGSLPEPALVSARERVLASTRERLFLLCFLCTLSKARKMANYTLALPRM